MAKKFKVGLDIGHRDHTFPNVGKGVFKDGKGYAEFDFNQKLGLRIKEILEAHAIEVVMQPNYASRKENLTERTNFFNAQKVDILVSIHANAGVASAHGRCMFYWHTSTNGKKLATLIRDEIGSKGYSLHGNGLHASQRGSWTNLHMVRETKMPAVLIEHGFMTNNADFELIFGNKQAQYIEDMAEADAKGILSYFGIKYKGKGKAKEPVKQTKGETLFRVQLGAFANKKNAEDLVKVLKSKGFDAIVTFDGSLFRVQTGAYSVKKNAENQLKKVKGSGYADAFVTTKDGQFVHGNDGQDAPEAEPKTVSIDQLVKETLDGKHGNGEARERSLGQYYDEVQRRINQGSQPKKKRKTTAQLVEEVLAGKHGNGEARKRSLGSRYNEVQAEINKGSVGSSTKNPTLKKGSRVKLKGSATNYATGERIPSSIKNKTYTIQQVGKDRVLLQEILSWVFTKDVQ